MPRNLGERSVTGAARAGWGLVGALVCFACGGSVASDPRTCEAAPVAAGDPGSPAASPSAGPVAPAEWRWLGSPASGETLNAAWAAAQDDVWLVGDQGTVLRWDGRQRFTAAYDGPSRTDFRVVVGRSPNDVWVAGRGGALHFDGTRWRESDLMGAANLVSLWLGEGDSWAGLGEDGKRYESAGGESKLTSRFVHSRWREGAGSYWEVGKNGYLHSTRLGLATSLPEGAHARWATVDPPWSPHDPANEYVAVTGSGPDDVWAAFVRPGHKYGALAMGLVHWNGRTLTTEHVTTYAPALVGRSAGLLVSRDGVFTSFARREPGDPGAWLDDAQTANKLSRFGFHVAEFFDIGGGRTLASTGGASQLTPGLRATSALLEVDPVSGRARALDGALHEPLRGVAIDDTGTAWATVGLDERPFDGPLRLVRWAGQWREVGLPEGFVTRGLLGGTSSRAKVYALGDVGFRAAVLELSGDRVVERSMGLTLGSLEGVGVDDQGTPWLRESGALRAFDGTSWAPIAVPCEGSYLHGMSATGPAVACGSIHVWRDGRFQELVKMPAVQTKVEARAAEGSLWVSSPTDIWVGGTHYDGARWEALSEMGLRSLGGPAADDRWFYRAYDAGLLRWDGRALRRERTYTDLGGGTYSRGRLWLVGRAGKTLVYGPPM